MLAMPRTPREGPAQAVIWVAGCAVLLGAAAWLLPAFLPGLIVALLAFCGVALAWRHLIAFWVAWLLVAGLSLEMALTDLFGPDAFQLTIAAVKGAEIGLVALTIFRAGLVGDLLNPAFGFVWIAAAGLVTGMHPELTQLDMLRSLAGSITPFLVFFCVKPAGWGAAIRTAVSYVPLLSVALGLCLDLAGLRPVAFESGGLRLAGLGHPAFLAGVCLPAIYAGLLRWLHTASWRVALLLGLNFIILILTGARAPLAYASFVVVSSLILVPDAATPRAHRLVLAAAGIAAVLSLIHICSIRPPL